MQDRPTEHVPFGKGSREDELDVVLLGDGQDHLRHLMRRASLRHSRRVRAARDGRMGFHRSSLARRHSPKAALIELASTAQPSNGRASISSVVLRVEQWL